MTEIHNVHARVIPATPAQIAPLIHDLKTIWPLEIALAPSALGERIYSAPPMIWEEVERPGATRAFRVLAPTDLQATHWFELIRVGAGTLVKHVLEGSARGRVESAWRTRIEPLHDRILEALLDNIEQAVAAVEGGAAA